jgi:hypothetical protein
MVARMAAASKCRKKKCKKPEKPILAEDLRRPHPLLCHCTPSFKEKPQVLTGLIQSIIQMHKPT